MGPPDRKETENWKSEILGTQKKTILEEVLPYVATNMALQRLYSEYKGQVKADCKHSHYWEDEVESVKPLFALKFTNSLQLKYFKETLGEAEIACINGYNESMGTKQKAHSGGGWPTTTPTSPDGLLMIIYRAVFIDEDKYDDFFARKQKAGPKGGDTYRKRPRDED